MMPSLAGLVGALIGTVIGVLDFGLVATLLRRAWAKSRGLPAEAPNAFSREGILKVAFVVNTVVFAGLGYWFGVAMAG